MPNDSRPDAPGQGTMTDHGQQAVADAASRHGIAPDAAHALLAALQHGHGTAAQFSHPGLGGMGQWSRGGMTQIGEMSNTDLKHRVAALAENLAQLLNDRSLFGAGNPAREHQPDSKPETQASGNTWWPAELGTPSATGAQNDAQYALFANHRRLAVRTGGRVHVYDSADHQIGGFSQAQQSGSAATLRFQSQHGPITLADLTEIT